MTSNQSAELIQHHDHFPTLRVFLLVVVQDDHNHPVLLKAFVFPAIKRAWVVNQKPGAKTQTGESDCFHNQTSTALKSSDSNDSSTMARA
jgi:hypothetical protein